MELQMNKFEIVDMPGMDTIAFFVERKFAEENGAVCGGAEAPAL